MRSHNPAFASTPDDQLVVLAQSGDNTAFTELIERHMSTCKRLAFSILHDQSDAEDEVQNACWKAFEHLSQFQQDAKFSTWLSRIVVNQCLMRLRKDRRARFLYLDEGVQGEEIATIDLASEAPSPEETLAQLEVSDVLKKEIRRIPPLLRDVFVLRDVEELPMEEVAGRLGISIAAAKSRLLRARLELRSRLSKPLGKASPTPLLDSS
jgi:RNA polymerase sigma-70 factor (ECF subfamily)